METVKKVKFPIASIFFLLAGLFCIYGVLSTTLTLIIMHGEINDSLYSQYLSSQIMTIFYYGFSGLTYFYLAIILFCKKRNGLLIGGVASLFVVPLFNFIYGFIFNKGYKTLDFSFASFKDVINTLAGNYIGTAINFLFLIVLTLTVIFLIKKNKFFGKIWFIPALMYVLYNISTTVLSSIQYGLTYFGSDFDKGFAPFAMTIGGYVVIFIFAYIPLTLAFLFLTKWLRNPYKIVKVQETTENSVSIEETPVYDNNNVIVEEEKETTS